MATKLTLKPSHQLTINPVIQTFIGFLPLNRIEFIDKIKNEVESNPMLEIEASEPPENKDGSDVNYIEKKLEDAVEIDGIRFRSQVLRKNLDKVERVFPYVITIGGKLMEKARTFDDVLRQYYFDIIGTVALTAARKNFEEQLRSRYALGGMSRMSPGSLADWPIEEQRILFSLLGDVEASIGVKLSGSLVMIPQKSISGIYFPTEISFYSCQLCPRKRCPSRQSGYNKEMAREYGILK